MQKTESNVAKGKRGEELAAEYLQSKGYKIITKNWRMGSLEIDLIVEKDNWLAFVEVKMRNSANFGGPWEAVNQRKRRNIINAADIYIKKHQVTKHIRFDIVSIIAINGKHDYLHIEDAFYPLA
jgi:putative endonuclease